MKTDIRKMIKKEAKLPLISMLCISATIFFSGCQKTETPEPQVETTDVASGVAAPTGIVKSAVRHSEDTANVTKWWDINEKKSAVQLAREEKIAKEQKLLQDAKLAQEAKILAAKTAASARELTKAAPVIAPAPVVVKVPDLIPQTAAVKPVQQAPVAVQNQDVLKLLSSTQPSFPRSAEKDGITEGSVSARLFIEKNGSVSKVEIIDARPKKYFDKEVIASLLGWKYAPLVNPQTKIVEINFKPEGSSTASTAKAAVQPVVVAGKQDALKLISGAQPAFPIAAARVGITQGVVNARLFIEKNGTVSNVEIVSANPRKYFDKEVVAALLTWKYAAVSQAQSKVVEIKFDSEN